MPKEQRADLHERFAGWLEGVAGERLPEYEEILAHHLEQAYRYRIELGPRTSTPGSWRTPRPSDSCPPPIGPCAAATSPRRAPARARRRPPGGLGAGPGPRRARLHERALPRLPCRRALAGEAIAEAEASNDRIAALRARIIQADSMGQVDPTYTLSRVTRRGRGGPRGARGARDEKGIVRGTVAAARAAFFAGHCDEATELVERLLERVPTISARESREVATSC